MSQQVIGRGIIEVSGDSSKLNAAISEARRSISSLGEANKQASEKASTSIDRYIKKLETQQRTSSMTTREAELYKLALRGASDEQLRAANSILKLNEANQRGIDIGSQLRAGFLAVSAAAAAAVATGVVAFDSLIKKAGDFQDMGEKAGDSAENIASLALAAGTVGVEMDSVISASVRLTKSLTGVDDESKAAGAAVEALGLDLKTFKELRPADQLEALGKALNSFEDGPQKAAVAMALLGKSGADLLPFLKALGEEGGRQNILTKEQIRLADEYADSQAKMRTAVGLHASAIATEALPVIREFSAFLKEIAKDQEFAATSSDLLKGVMKGAVIVFQTIAVVASDVGFVFRGVYKEIEAIGGQLVALSSLDFEGFHAISDAVKADAEKARAELDRFQARVMAIGQPSLPPDPTNYGNKGRGVPAPKSSGKSGSINFDGGAGKSKKAKADAYVDLLTPAAKEYASALEKIASAEIAADKATRSLDSAQSSLFELMRSPEWEQMPETWRQTAIEQTALASASIKAMEAEKRLNDMIAATPNEKIKEAQQDMLLLADALEKNKISESQFIEAAQARIGTLPETAKEAVSSMDTVITNAFQGMGDTIADFVLTGKASFGDLVNSMVRDLIRLEIQTSMTTLWKEFGGFGGIMKTIAGAFAGGDVVASAKGNVFQGVPSLSAYSGSIVTRPTIFPFAMGAGLMGEAGAEGIFPLKRGRDGKLGISAEGGASTNVTINVDASGTRTEGDAGAGRELGRKIESAVRSVLMAEKRNGGLLSGA